MYSEIDVGGYMISWDDNINYTNASEALGFLCIILLAKVARADGRVTKDECDFIKKKLNSKGEKQKQNQQYIRKHSIDKKITYIDISKKIFEITKDENVLRRILEILAELIWADNKEHINETKLFHKVGKIFSFSDTESDNILEDFRK